MFYKKYEPSHELKSFIHTYYLWEDLRDENPLIIESPPSAYGGIVFNFGDQYMAGVYDHQLEITPRIFFTGQATKSYTLELFGRISMIGLVLKATTLYYLISEEQKSFLNKRMSLSDFIGNEIQALFDRLKSTINDENKISLLDTYFTEIIRSKGIARDRFDDSVDFIDAKFGNTTLNEVVEKFGFSSRYYQKLFIRRVGVSPKSYMRMRRMSHICHLLQTQKEINWQDIVFEGGYFDQSHFIKDFLDFIGRNPSIYFKENRELARLLT